jgi:acylphosphatase
MEELRRRHLWLSGRVQGVGYRWRARTRAETLGILGWVRNLPDGRVELSIQGPEESLDAMEEWCRRGHPPARVDRVESREEEPDPSYRTFVVE